MSHLSQSFWWKRSPERGILGFSEHKNVSHFSNKTPIQERSAMCKKETFALTLFFGSGFQIAILVSSLDHTYAIRIVRYHHPSSGRLAHGVGDHN